MQKGKNIRYTPQPHSRTTPLIIFYCMTSAFDNIAVTPSTIMYQLRYQTLYYSNIIHT